MSLLTLGLAGLELAGRRERRESAGLVAWPAIGNGESEAIWSVHSKLFSSDGSG
jgi:hypothetical protein